LESFSKPLVQKLLDLKSGQKALVKVDVQNELLQIAINATEFRLRDQNFTLVSLQNIQSELEEKELEAWQNLIRVLTHEIMNSVTPIASLASTINDLLNSNGQKTSAALNNETRSDVNGALRTIQKRSEGLLHFVDAYRNLTRLPVPNFQIFSVQELFKRVYHLMQVDLAQTIRFDYSVIPESLELTADSELVEQILINILKNAIHAVTERENPRIDLTSKIDDRGRVIIQVTDNGPGIPKDMLDKIFIPFFTTKENGSGIGLSLSRQIMRLHRGTITVRSQPNEQTVFTLRF
jgi:signal transduction histidine kinase